LLVFAAPATMLAASRERPPEVADIAVERDGDRIRVFYRLVDCLQPETIERIESGIPIRYKHRIEIVEKRPGLFARDRVFSRTLLDTSVQYDSLTERYELTRRTQLKRRQQQPELDPIEERTLSASAEEMRAWLTVVDGVPLFIPQGHEDVEYHVRIEVAIGRRWVLLIIPSSHTIDHESSVEFGN
jgi:hypothetical protein